MNLFTFFAAEDIHISLKPEPVFTFAGYDVTNSLIYGFVVSLAILVMGIFAARKAGINPRRGWLITPFELMIEFIRDLLEGVFHSKKKAAQYTPIFATFFIFIVFSNLSGLLPLVGSGIAVDGIPVFRPFTADLNGTIAMSVIAIITVQVLSIKESGLLGHLKHYFTDKPFNPINTFIGILEVFGEFTRIVSLALRLFLNTAVGEILIAVFIFVGGYGASFTLLPIVLFEVLVALIQAYVFTVLCATYLALAIHHEEDSHAIDEAPTHSDPELILAKELG